MLFLLLYVRNIPQLFHDHALAIIISYPTRESTIIALLEKKTAPEKLKDKVDFIVFFLTSKWILLKQYRG